MITEPVTVEFFKTYSRINSSIEDNIIELLIASAREKAEQYCNRDFVSKQVNRTFPINVSADVALADMVAVTGFYSSLDDVADAYSHFNEYTKGITVNRDYPIYCDNLPTYTLTYNVTVAAGDVPAAVKTAICKIAADLYENRESSTNELNKELSIGFKSLLAPYKIL